MRFRLNPLAFSLLCFFAPAVCAEEDMLMLKLDRTFMSSPKNYDETPVFISAQRLEGKKGNQVEAVGEAELRKQGQAISADHLLYSQNSKDVVADGAVRLEQDGNVVRSPHLQLNLDTNIGVMTQPAFYLSGNHARGSADALYMKDRQNYTLHNVTYTTCPADKDDWLLQVRDLEIDRNRQMGVAHNARVEFMGVPILYTPWMDFALNDQRKSGFLGPVFGSTVQGGSELTLPYYWNIAPNRDATIAPRVMAKRGILLNNELRYLEPAYSGEAHLDVLPGDRLANRTRSRLALTHAQNFGHGLSGSINLNDVSDDAYFRDLSGAVSSTSQTNLVREGVLSYGGGWWNAAARVQSFQTLQDPAVPVVEPYHRLPQISLGAQRTLAKAGVSLAGEFVDFRHPTLVNGQRLVLYPSVSYPLIAEPAFYLTPKFGLHNTYYTMGANNAGALPNTSRTVPIFSLDSGITLERNGSLAGQNFVQTLEPRAYYVHIPYRDQSQLPNFDTAQADFSFAQMFTENRFFGSDRIGDANQVTLAITSRLLEPDSGAERMRFAIGERFSAKTPQVNLPPVIPVATPMVTPIVPATTKSDIVLAASGQVTRAWSLDSTFQFTPNQSQSQLFNASARYQPESGKVLNLGYRFTRNSLRQMDLSTQWPLSGRWQAVARWNYSLQDSLILEALAGLEYNEKCWAVRLVAQRFATATQQTATGFFVQLELNDLVMVGPDPLTLLRQSVPGYTKLNEPSRDKPAQGLR
ncbi:MAG: LPS-assembly protein LptD [Betaproteobacteria bacterium]|nr:LPS-assembly protein LptD [Betaproteobacteria bacterium]